MAIRWADVSDSGSPRISSLVSTPGALDERVDLAMEDLAERPGDDARDSSERESSRSCRSSSVIRERMSSKRPAARSRCDSEMNG
jgi:hypothetical protein